VPHPKRPPVPAVVSDRVSGGLSDERYRLSLTYDQACEVAVLLDEVSGTEEREQLANELDEERGAVQGLREQVDDLKEEVEVLRDRLAAVEEERDALAAELDELERDEA
jgi:septal ring factor EnvC (AmiA/AmiB activator)